MAVVYCGLDAGTSVCHVVGMEESGKVVVNRKFPTTEANLIDAFAEIPGELHVHLEASTLAGWIRDVLKSRVRRVVVSHPQENAWIAKDPRKSDGRDAFKLGDLLRRQAPIKEVYYPDDRTRMGFKRAVQQYDDLTNLETRAKFKIKACLRAQGVFPRGEEVYTKKGRARFVARVTDPISRELLNQRYALLDHMLTARARARRLMAREAKRFPEVELLDGAPGVGPIGACQYVAYVQTPHRFSSKRKLWRYCRLGITTRSSDGKPIGRQSLDYNGNGRLKAMSYAAFWGAMRKKGDNLFKRTYAESLQRTQNSVHARLSTQRKIVAVLRAMWKGGQAYRNDQG